MTATQPLVGPGHFQWNAGGWFGALLGGTLYLALGAVFFLSVSWHLSLVWFACWIVALVVGGWLWTRRDRVYPYPAIQRLLAVLGVSALVACATLVLLARGALEDMALSPFGAPSPIGVMACLLVFPAMMIQFAWLERRARRATEGHGA